LGDRLLELLEMLDLCELEHVMGEGIDGYPWEERDLHQLLLLLVEELGLPD
jgi:hypothetical protein